MKRSLIVDTHASSCYFRTSVEGNDRKALVQITERCNLHCAHCFVSSGKTGVDIPFADIEQIGDVDTEQCPVPGRPLLQIGRRRA